MGEADRLEHLPGATAGRPVFVANVERHFDVLGSCRLRQQGYALNYPMIPVTSNVHNGSLPARHSFVRLDRNNVILTVVKKAEDDDALIFRFYEFAGRKSAVRFHLPDKATRAFETNLMEKQERALTLEEDGREVVIPAGPYEIKTVKVFFAH